MSVFKSIKLPRPACRFYLLSASLFLSCITYGQQNTSPSSRVYTITANQIKAHIEPTMYGIFFEDINMAADGGVYAELVKNRSFEFASNLAGWTEHIKNGSKAKLSVVSRAEERPENPHVANVTIPTFNWLHKP